MRFVAGCGTVRQEIRGLPALVGARTRVDVDRDARRSERGNAVAGTVNKHIRIDGEIWERLEAAAKDCETTANRLLAELAAQWLENREWPRTDVQIQVARSSLFTAQAVSRDMIAAGREKEIQEIRSLISTIVPDMDIEQPAVSQSSKKSGDVDKDGSLT